MLRSEGDLKKPVVLRVAGDVADAVVRLDGAGVEAVVERLDRLRRSPGWRRAPRQGRAAAPARWQAPQAPRGPRKIALPWFSAAVKLGG
jgi:hypothetical protein